MTLRLNCVFLLPLVGKFAFETIIIDRSNIYNVEGLHFVKHSSILKSADEYNIPVYIRGLIDNDFKKTVLFIRDIIQKNDLSGVSIDPVLFKEFKIR